MHKSAAYWEGWQAVQTRQPCRYTEGRDRADWAKGFAAGVEEDRGSKVWWRSKTMIVGLSLLVVGVGVAIYGMMGSGGDGQVYTGFGAGVGGTSLLTMALRLITGTRVSLSGGGEDGA